MFACSGGPGPGAFGAFGGGPGGGAYDDFAKDMEALDLKEEAQRLQRDGNLEKALPLMKKSVALREASHTICLSLSELADLYIEMLKLDEAEATGRRMLQEAHRYDAANQTRIANDILAEIAKERPLDLAYGTCVQLHDLISRPELNSQEGIIRGKRENGRYIVEVSSSRMLLQRKNFSHAMRIVQISISKEEDGKVLITGTILSGQRCASVRLGSLQDLAAADLRRRVAEQMQCQPRTVKLVLASGACIEDSHVGDAMLLLEAEGKSNSSTSVAPGN